MGHCQGGTLTTLLSSRTGREQSVCPLAASLPQVVPIPTVKKRTVAP